MKRNSALFIAFLVFLNYNTGLFGFKQPNNPKNPLVNQKEKEIEKSKNLLPIQVQLTFYGKDTSFKGKISIQNFKLIIVSEKNGFQFYKEMSLQEIKSIRILKWKGFPFKNSKDGRHNFYPISYEIVDHKGTSFIYQKNIPEINDFVFETEYGTTKVFSYYVDYYNNGIWEMSKRRNQDLETSKALRKVIQEIEIEELIQKQNADQTKTQ